MSSRWTWILFGFFSCLLLLSVFSSTAVLADSSNNANRQSNGQGGFDLNLDGQTFFWQGKNKAPDGDTANYLDQSKDNYIYKNQHVASCDSVIVITGDPGKATSAKYFPRHHTGLGMGPCRVDGDNIHTITIDNGLDLDHKQRKELNDQRQDTLNTKAYNICVGDNNNSMSDCKQKLQNAFDECYDQLGGGSGIHRYDKDVSQSDMAQCMHDKTGFSESVLNSALTPETSDSEKSSCNITGVGWVICQVSRFMGKLADGAFAVLKQLLAVPSIKEGTPGGDTLYTTWSSFRNVANVVFVIFLLIIIYSQLTNVGISNYGIKRLLPRLVVAVILVNLSYVICEALIDLSNIAGASLNGMLSTAAVYVKPDLDGWGATMSIALALGAGVALYMTILLLIPILVSGILSLLLAILLLLARQALIVLLVLLAPLAFVLNILPNTQQWFKKWWNGFIMVLLMFPIISVVYGGSKIAAGVVSAASPSNQAAQVTFAIIALGIQTIPFFLVPIMMKSGGQFFGKMSGGISKITSPASGWAKNRSKEKAEDWKKARDINAITQDKKGLYGRVAKRQAKRNYANSYAEKELKGDTLNKFLGDKKVAAQIAKAGSAGSVGMSEAGAAGWARSKMKGTPSDEDGSDSADDNESNSDHETIADRQASADEQRNKDIENIKSGLEDTSLQVEISNIEAEEAVLEDENYSLSELDDAVKGGIDKHGNPISDAAKAAAAKQTVKTGDVDKIHDMLRFVKETGLYKDESMRHTIADGIDQSGVSKEALHLGGSGSQSIRNGEAFNQDGDVVDNLYGLASRNDKYNTNSLATQNSKSLSGLHRAMSSGAVSPEHSSAIHQSAQAIEKSESVRHQTKMGRAARREASKL